MAVIKNPTQEQIEKALSLVTPSNIITAHRYAMTADGSAFLTSDGCVGTLAVGKNLIKAVRSIMVYSGVTANVMNILTNIDMYPKENIESRGYIAVHPKELPEIFKDMETTIYEL